MNRNLYIFSTLFPVALSLWLLATGHDDAAATFIAAGYVIAILGELK